MDAGFGGRIPDAQRTITAAGYDELAVRGDCYTSNKVGMAGQIVEVG